MSLEMEFKNILAQYSKVAPEEMSFLGELEDTFDIELEENEVMKIVTLGEALQLLENLQ